METANEDFLQRTVNTKSFVIGKKVENQTGINLIDLDNISNTQERPFPVKVLYVKPTKEQKTKLKSKPHLEKQEINKENSDSNVIQVPKVLDLKNLPLAKDFPKTNAVDSQLKLQQQKHRPKSATTHQLTKDQIKHSKLGPNSSIKPQISYVKKVSSLQPKSKPLKPKKEQVLSPPRQYTEIPFAENRLKGQFPSLTKELFKKAQEAIKEEKEKQKKLKEEQQLKKEKQKQLQDEVKKQNQELVEKQKEKGLEHIDIRRKEQEKVEQARKQENKEEREKQKELRKKRKEEGRTILGLEMFNTDKIEEYRKKVQDQKPKEEKPIKVLAQERPKSSNPILKHLNKDLKIQLKEEQLKEQIDEIEEQARKEGMRRDRGQLLQQQKKQRKQKMLEQQQQQELERLRKEEAMMKLELQLRQQKEENLKRQEMKQRMREEQERLERELEEEEFKKSKKAKKNKKAKQVPGTHLEQMNELRDWIEVQMAKEEARDSDEEIQKSEKPSKIMVRIDKKDSQQDNQSQHPNASFVSGKSGSQKSNLKQKKNSSQDNSFLNGNSVKQLKFDLPGNMDLDFQDNQKYAARQNRYGIYGDNGYSELIEIKRRKMDDTDVSKEKQQELRLSKEGLVTVIQKISEYQKQKEVSPVKNLSNKRVVLIAKHAHQDEILVPGVVSIEQELKKQKQVQQEREVEATIVMQKWTRGFLARHEVRNKRENKRKEIEEEYGHFEDQVKFNTDYNLQKFLKEKQKLREKNKTSVLADSISENIGQSSTLLGKSLKQPMPKNDNVMLQNFFKEKPDTDPLSIISIFAKRNAPKVVPSVQKSPLKTPRQEHKKRVLQDNSDIEEEIYSESFEQDDIKSNIIEEDIIVTGSNKGLSSESQSKDLKIKNQPFAYKQQTSIAESIQEDIMMSPDRRSKRGSPDRYDRHDSSIAEESGLHGMSASRSSYHKKESLIEESINEIKSEYEEEFDSYSGSAQRVNKIQIEKEKTANQKAKEEHLQQVSAFEIKLQADQTKRKEVVNELLTEMKRYEEASISTVVVERMEKIINHSLAQKDKILLAQRLHELELEKQHKDEINKIREEQIKLLSQLVLMGGNGSSQQNTEQKQQMMDNIQKIFDKPIIIQSEKDDIQESIQQSKRVEDSIKESIVMSNSKQDEESDIAEDIIEASASKESEDEIKESVYVNGQKVDEKQPAQVDKGLSKMRMALGSEEAVRQQSKKTLQGDKETLKSSGLFDKHSFEEFTHEKFKQLLIDEKAPTAILDQVEKAIEEKEQHESHKLIQDLKKNLISPRTFKRKERELEKWVLIEKKELSIKKKKMVQTYDEVGQYLNRMKTEKQHMLEVIGSPRPQKRLFDSQSSLDYDEIDEESNESVRMKQARSQLQKLTHSLSKDEDPIDVEIRKKKAAAKKLMEEKERAIEEGMKDKLKNIEVQKVDNMLNLALKLDVHQEIEKRINQAKKVIEESSENFDSARSPYSQSQKSVMTVEEIGKKKKNVKFASPEQRYSNYDQSSEGASSKQKSNRFEDSIGESIKIEDSYNVSGSIPLSAHQQSESRKSQSNEKVIKESVRSDFIQESIKESVAEDVESSNAYSDDFVAQSQLSQSKNLQESKNKLQTKVATIEDDGDIGYSMNFDEDSMSQSLQLNNNAKQPDYQKSNSISQVQEESADQEEDNQDYSYQDDHLTSKKESDSNEVMEEGLEDSNAYSSKFQSSMAQAQDESDLISEDKEVVYSTRSVDWQIQIQELESQRSKKQLTEEDEKYSEDFEEVEEIQQVSINESKKEEEEEQNKTEEDNLDDLESFPDEIEESFDDFQEKADKFTNEFFELLLDEIRENPELNINQVLDENDFKDKFPFNIEPEIEEAPAPISAVKVETTKKREPAPKKQTEEEIARAKYEKELQKQKEQTQQLEQYLDLLISNINKQDLINALEKPIDIDPLKKLAQIFQQSDNDESLHVDVSKEQFLLPLDFFRRVEDQHKQLQQFDDLTESALITYQKHDYFHHKAVFDAFNQALDLERPYKEKGQPAPWSKQTRVVQPKITTKQLDLVLKKSKERLLLWSKTSAGTRLAPLPPPPPASNDYDNPPPQQPLQPEEERINGAREERLGMLMMKELEENENKWIDYEDEDTQVKFDLADMILDDLAGELVDLITALKSSKK